MITKFHELKKEWKELTSQEAQRIFDTTPSIIVSPGYVNIHDGEGHYYYCAMGVLPDCLRGGPPSTFSKIKGPHYHINIRDLVRLKGFYPSFFSNGYLMTYQLNSGDYSVYFDDLIKECVNCNLSAEDLKDQYKSSDHFYKLLTPLDTIEGPVSVEILKGRR